MIDKMVFKRGKTYYYEFQYEGKRIRQSAKTTNRTVALHNEAKARIGTVSGSVVIDERPRDFEELFSQFLSWCSSHVKPNTLKRYRVSGKRLTANFNVKFLQDVRLQDIEAFKTRRSQECSNAGVNRDLACLRTFFNWCITQGYLDKNPFRGIKMLREPVGKMRIVSPEEEELYLAQADQPLHDVAVLMLNTGMRPYEVFSLHSAHVHDDYIRVVEGKTVYARRTIPLNDRARQIVQKRKNGAYLFPGRFDGHIKQVRQHDSLTRRLKMDFRLYDLRHTFGSRMAMAGVDLATLKELMGHSTITMTMRYVHPNPEHKKKAIAKLEGICR
jgi:integrase